MAVTKLRGTEEVQGQLVHETCHDLRDTLLCTGASLQQHSCAWSMGLHKGTHNVMMLPTSQGELARSADSALSSKALSLHTAFCCNTGRPGFRTGFYF